MRSITRQDVECALAMMKSDIDAWLTSASRSESPGTPESVSVHKMLMGVCEKIADIEKRSLASKYLHFHLPNVFFIYDSRARKAITRVVPRLNHIPEIGANAYDREYKDFVRRCVWLRNYIHSAHDQPTGG